MLCIYLALTLTMYDRELVPSHHHEPVEYERFTVTFYTNDDPTADGRGITASGVRTKEGVTIACDPDILPLGTEVYIPYFDNTYICQDTGGAIKGYKLDIFLEDRAEALRRGVMENLRVVIQ